MMKPFRISSIILVCLLSFYHTTAQTGIEFTTSNSYFRVADHVDLHLETFTLECWIQISDSGSVSLMGVDSIEVVPIISRGKTDLEEDAGMNYFLGLRRNDFTLMAGFQSSPSSLFPFTTYTIYGFSSLIKDTWYHVAFTFDGVSLRLYLNGHLESLLETPIASFQEVPAPLCIAHFLDKSNQPEGEFIGGIDALRIWDYTRSQEEILQTINSEINTNESGLVYSLNFNEDEGDPFQAYGTASDAVIDMANLTQIKGASFQTLVPPIVQDQPTIKFGIISDAQYCDCDVDDNRHYRKTLNKLPVALDTMNQHQIDFLINSGDVIDKYIESFDSILPLYESLDAPNYFVLGNHDFEEIHDTLMDDIVNILEMPDYYYSFVENNWRFIVLDGTELAAYTSILHPELQEEADSIRQSVEGQKNDVDWNGGISKTQQTWMHEELSEAIALQQQTILFCHFQVYPEDHRLVLWNHNAVIDLLKQYPNVVAFINGHNHEGSYGITNQTHYLTHAAMCDTDTLNSFSIAEIYSNKIVLNGSGLNRDRVLSYKNHFKRIALPELSDSIFRYNTKEGELIGILTNHNLTEGRQAFSLFGDSSHYDQNYFMLKNDSIFLSAYPNAGKKQFQLKLGIIDSEFDSVSVVYPIYIDTVSIVRNKMPQDIVLHIDSTATINMDSLFLDYSRNGLTYSISIRNSALLDYSIEDNNLQLLPADTGITFLEIRALDEFTGFMMTDTIEIYIYDTETETETETNKLRSLSSILEISTYPIPARNEIYIDISLSEADELKLILFDPKGRKVYESQKLYSTAGIMEYSISLDGLPNGMYVLELSSSLSRVKATRKILVQK